MDKIQEKCGIVGLISPVFSRKLPTAILAAAGLQHRGQHGAGLAMYTKTGLVKHTDSGLLNEVFTKKTFEKYDSESLWTLIHLRYGTFGGYDACNLQPCVVKSSSGEEIAVLHNGEFAAVDKMKQTLGNKNLPKSASDTYIFTEFLSQADGNSWDEKIISTIKSVTGAFSLIVTVGEVLYVIRDQFGIRPLFIGKVADEFLVASETHAFDKVGGKVEREVRRGEIIKVDRQGTTILEKGGMTPSHYCDFEWAYFSRPDSLSPTRDKPDNGDYPEQWISYASFRERCGEILAKEKPIKNASFVVGTPDSGLAFAMGYAQASHLPYKQVILRDHFDPNGMQRLFMRDDQMHLIKKKVLGKLSLVPDRMVWKDAVVVIGDDSIVRGNVSKQMTKAIFGLGAREVHWIIGFPPVAYPCHLGVSMRSDSELIANRFASDPKKIAQEIEANSVNYISPEGFVKARTLTGNVKIPMNPKEIFLANGGCGGCITGLYPVAKDGELYPRFTS